MLFLLFFPHLVTQKIAYKFLLKLYSYQILDWIFLSTCFLSVSTGLLFFLELIDCRHHWSEFIGLHLSFWVNIAKWLFSLKNWGAGVQIYEAYDQSLPKNNTKPVLIKKRKQVDKKDWIHNIAWEIYKHFLDKGFSAQPSVKNTVKTLILWNICTI